MLCAWAWKPSSQHAGEKRGVVRKSIHRYDLASGATEQLPLTGLRSAVALDFDYDRNCLYWSDLALDVIQVRLPWVCLWGPCLVTAESW